MLIAVINNSTFKNLIDITFAINVTACSIFLTYDLIKRNSTEQMTKRCIDSVILQCISTVGCGIVSAFK